MRHHIQALFAAIICSLLLSAQAFAAGVDSAETTEDGYTPFGFLDYYLGDVADVAGLEAAGFALDPYYDPAIFYSRDDVLDFTHGPEDYRLDIGLSDNVIETIVVEFNALIPSADGESLDLRPHFEEIATEIAQQLDAKYGAWESETWEYASDDFAISTFDFLSEDYALSLRISSIAITLIYTSAAARQTKEEFILESGLPEETAPAEADAPTASN